MSAHEEELLNLIAEEALIDRAKLQTDMTLEAIGIDSVDVVSVLFALEEKYDVRVETEELSKDQTLGDVIALVEAKIAAKAPA
ncbi:MAG: acyl carrier protein [Pseudomonadota bacterium]